MITGLKNFSFILIFNLSLFLMLMVGIQNSSQRSEVNFLNNKTIDLPISFIIGINFIAGSLISNFIFLKKKQND